MQFGTSEGEVASERKLEGFHRQNLNRYCFLVGICVSTLPGCGAVNGKVQ